jgi:hypothetical protein
MHWLHNYYWKEAQELCLTIGSNTLGALIRVESHYLNTRGRQVSSKFGGPMLRIDEWSDYGPLQAAKYLLYSRSCRD